MQLISTPSLTFDDVLLKPGYAGFSREDIDLKTKISKNVTLAAPFVSAPMDTVTESRLAISLGRFGGIGIIHRNLTIKEQAAEVNIVKKAGQLVGAAVGSSPGFEKRVEAIVEAGADIVVVDSAHGYSKYVIEATSFIKKNFNVDVVSGNIATADGAKALIDAGADGLRVGMGPGAICTTRIVSGMGVPQLTAIIDTAEVAAGHGVPIIADGGINYLGDMVKALACGASCVMMGRLFAATEESPGEVVEFSKEQVPSRFRSIINGQEKYRFKSYRGMGSIGAMERGKRISSEDEFHGKSYDNKSVLVAEGVEGLVPSSGFLDQVAATMVEGIKSGFYYVGAKTIPDLWRDAVMSTITTASLTESHPHDLFITNAGNSYPK
ncbi:MAG TPA: IMP dehydrogenase [Candidatus Saccharimonadales bacterium]|nr:IMP dehydrogenase [Candidatus Saccharimonadales bacterium]